MKEAAGSLAGDKRLLQLCPPGLEWGSSIRARRMLLRPVWILAFALALVCTAAQARAAPCGDDSCGKREDRDASSIHLEPPANARERSHDAWPPRTDELPTELSPKVELPPGLRDDFDGRAREWRGRVATAVSIQDPRTPARLLLGSPPRNQKEGSAT